MRPWIAASIAAIAVALGWAMSAEAQGTGRKPVTILVGFPAGQATDLVARLIAEPLRLALDRPVLIENKPGQGGSVVLGALARAPADGSTLSLSALAAYSVNPHLYKNVAYDTLKDLDPIALVAELPLVLVVNAGVPVKSVAELVAHAKANPGRLNHGSSGYGTLSHLLMEDFKKRAGIEITHVPYQGSPRFMGDLVAGEVQVGLDTVTVAQPHVRAGTLRLLAAGSRNRLPEFPEAPTIAESGFPGFEGVAWLGLTGPAGLPAEFRDRVAQALGETLRSPEFVGKLQTIGAIARPSSTAEFRAFLASEYRRWGTVVKESGVKVE